MQSVWIWKRGISHVFTRYKSFLSFRRADTSAQRVTMNARTLITGRISAAGNDAFSNGRVYYIIRVVLTPFTFRGRFMSSLKYNAHKCQDILRYWTAPANENAKLSLNICDHVKRGWKLLGCFWNWNFRNIIQKAIDRLEHMQMDMKISLAQRAHTLEQGHLSVFVQLYIRILRESSDFASGV